MTTIEELNTQIKKINDRVANRKDKANKLNLPEKIYEIAKTYGEGECGYFYSEEGLSIAGSKSIARSSKTITVTLGDLNNQTFNATIYNNSVDEIHLYIPGEWEKRIEELYSEIPEIQRKREVSLLQNKIKSLKKKWKLGEIS